MRLKLLVLSLSILLICCKHTDRKVENIHSFAKLYGYVRWFYPGDEASTIDWEKFAVYGVQKVEMARNQEELKKILLECFKPIAPALQIVNENQNIDFDFKLITPNDTNGLSSIFWIHYGVYLGEKSNIYKSIRNNRDTVNWSWASNKHVKPGEFVKKKIGSNLVIIMPLALFGSKEHTFPASDTISLKQLNRNLSQILDKSLNTSNISVKLSNVVIAWNVFQHFYPYFDVVKVDWEKEFLEALINVYKGKSEPDYFKALSKMVAKLEDGHGVVFTDKIKQWGLPVSVEWIENKIVVTGTSDTTSFKLGDIIVNIDGRSAYEELLNQESLVSGSPWLKRYRALNIFGSDFSKSEAHIKILRDSKDLTLKLQRQTICNLFFNPLFKGNECDFSECGKKVYYLNNYPFEIKYVMDTMLRANGIIIDNSRDLIKLIPHIIKQPVWSPRWNIPVTSYPDRIYTSFDTSGRWTIEPKEPFIKAKFVFLTHPYNVSSGETFLGIVDHYKLGKLVGDTTAGTNGNVNFINLMGGYRIMWTGMKVLKHDGSQHHLVGFKPDYPISRTIKAVKDGRNEYLEKAKKILQQKK